MDFEEAFRILDTAVFNHINRRLKPREIIVLRGSWQGLTYEQIANDSGYTEGFLRQDVGFHLWRLLSEVLKEEVSKTNFRGVVERLYRNQNISIGECPQSPLSAKSPFYVERTPIERHCYAEILRPGALIRIQAPRQMGKTSLLNRIIAHANQQGYYTVNLNFLRAEISIFTNLDKFLRWLCSYVSDRLRLELFLNAGHIFKITF
jgi:hypothetical protein